MDFDKGGMSFATFEEKLHALSRHATQLLTTEEDMIHLLLKGLNYEVHVLSVHRTFGVS